MTDLQYAALDTPDAIVIVCDITKDIYLISAGEDGQEVVDVIREMVELETSHEVLFEYLNSIEVLVEA